MTDFLKAKALLESGGYTCVLCKGEQVYTSTERGVLPLVEWLEGGAELRDFCAADKVVGRATAFLYVLLGVRAVYARVISKAALEVLARHGIVAEYGEAAENIINRRGDGVCPFEAATMEIDEPKAAYDAIRQKLRQMKTGPVSR